jgi:hypothetical protein
VRRQDADVWDGLQIWRVVVKAVADSRQGIILQLESWTGGGGG